MKFCTSVWRLNCRDVQKWIHEYKIENALNVMSLMLCAHSIFTQEVYLPLLIIGVVSGAPSSSEPTTTSVG